MAIFCLSHDWLNVLIDDLKSVEQFKLFDAVASSAPIGESGEIESFQTLLVAELLERVRNFCGATLDAFDDFGDTLGVCIARFSFISNLSVQFTIALRSSWSFSQPVLSVESGMILLSSTYNLHGNFSITDGRSLM